MWRAWERSGRKGQPMRQQAGGGAGQSRTEHQEHKKNQERPLACRYRCMPGRGLYRRAGSKYACGSLITKYASVGSCLHTGTGMGGAWVSVRG